MDPKGNNTVSSKKSSDNSSELDRANLAAAHAAVNHALECAKYAEKLSKEGDEEFRRATKAVLACKSASKSFDKKYPEISAKARDNLEEYYKKNPNCRPKKW